MGFDHHAEMFAGWPVADSHAAAFAVDVKKRFAPRFRIIRWEDDESRNLIAELGAFLARPEAARLPALVIGVWSHRMWQVSPSEVLARIVDARDRLSALRHLFVGDILYRESMSSDLIQADYGPLLSALPRLDTLRVRGSQGLAFGSPFRHPALRTLIVEDGGLRESVYDAVAEAELPALEHLELWIGTEEYGGIADMLPVRRLLAGLSRFPKLRYLGLRNAQLADDVVREVVASTVPASVRILDLSMGTLTDAGAEALLAWGAIRRLGRLDLHHHYMSPEMGQRLLGLGIPVDVSDRCEAYEDYDEDTLDVVRYRYAAVTE